jgi:hypothetical protein
MPWTEAARAAAAARIREQRPWQHATGPRSTEGSSRSSKNAFKGAMRPQLRELAAALRTIKAQSRNAAPQ